MHVIAPSATVSCTSVAKADRGCIGFALLQPRSALLTMLYVFLQATSTDTKNGMMLFYVILQLSCDQDSITISL